MAKSSPKIANSNAGGKARTPTASKPVKNRSGVGGGGPTASGGFNYQAAVTAIAMTYALRGAPLGWLDCLANDIGLSIASETGEGGDDLRLVLAEGSVVEVQVKKGLAKGASLWTALLDLARPLSTGAAQFGVLVVSPDSSGTIRSDLAKDIVAVGEGRALKATSHGAALVAQLQTAGWDPQAICKRLRIVTVAAAGSSDGDVRAALAHLSAICEVEAEASAAWDRFYRDAHVMIASRGRRDRAALAQVLTSAGLNLKDDLALPSGLLEQLSRWTQATNHDFSILGVARPLSIRSAYIELDPYVENGDPAPSTDLATAIARYHDWNERVPQRGGETSAPEALGRYFTRAVVVAGPGAGKSTLLSRVAVAYAEDGAPVLKAGARSVARRMAAGQGFEEAVFEDALDGAPVSARQARTLKGVDWTLLLDGLDESGQSQPSLIKGLKAFVEGRPETRVVVTTRPVGYQRAGLADWRHYSVPSLAEDSIDRALTGLLTHILPASDPRQKLLETQVKSATARSGSGKAALRTPLMLGLAAAQFAAGGTLGTSRTAFYRGVFDLIARAPSDRVPADPPAEAIRNRFLDTIGWALVALPQARRDAVLASGASTLKADLNLTSLAAEALAERCLDYWQALGVVEELTQAGERALTFVHKTFGEFAAGRFLATADMDMQRSALRGSQTDPGLREAVAFAASEGLAPMVLSELQAQGFSGDVGEQRLVQALDILIDAKPVLALPDADPILAAAMLAAGDDRAGPVGLIGLKLRILAKTYPDTLADAARPLVASRQVWTRLVGLSVGLAANPGQKTLEAWLDALASISNPPRDKADIRGFRGNDAFVDLVQAFARDIARRVIAEMTEEAASDAFERAFAGGDLNRVGFIIEMETLIHGTRIRPWWRTGFERAMPRFDADQINQAMRTGFLAFARGLQPLREPDAETAPLTRPLYTLSAFMRLVDFAGTSLPDFYPLADFGEEEDVRWLWRALATAAGLSLDHLWRDAAHMQAVLETGDEDALNSMFKHTFAVDIPPVNWERALPRPLDDRLLESTLRRSSSMVVSVAVQMAAAADLETVRRLARSLLNDGQEDALWAAATLSARLPRDEALDLLFGHASRPPRRGTKYVIQTLAALGADDDPRRQAVMAAMLLQDRIPSAATAAAKWFAASPIPADATLATDGYAFWSENEAPARASGSVPESARDDLLRGLLQLAPVPPVKLLEYWRDRRHDVRSVAKEAFGRLIDDDPTARDEIVGMAIAGTLPTEWLSLLVERSDRLRSDQGLNLLDRLDAPDAAQRLAAMPLLQTNMLSPAERRSRLQSLRKDTANEVRERAATMLLTEL